MTFADVIRERRSIRKFQTRAVPEAALRTMLEAAVRAPSAGNRQPWRFMVLRDPGVRDRLAVCVRAAIAETAGEIQAGYEDDFRSYCEHFLGFEQAPTVVVALFRTETTASGLLRENSPLHQRLGELERSGSVISTAMAVENLLLSATEQKIGSCVMTGPLIAEDAVAALLPVPDGWGILCFVCLGYADESPPPVPRKSVERVIIPMESAGATHAIH